MVIAISVYHCIPNLHEIWVEFGRGKIYNTWQFTEYQTMEQNITEYQTDYQTISASALPFFYALSGCDAILSIFGKSKKPLMDENFFQKLQAFVKLASVQ